MKSRFIAFSASLLLAVTSFGGLMAIGAESAAAASPSTLSMYGSLGQGQSLMSPNGQYVAVLQGDGNMVVYGPRGAVWSSGTMNRGGSTFVVQGDGNVVLYRSGGVPIWATGTSSTSPVQIVLQNDGNFVLYNATQALWSSLTGKIPLRQIAYGVNQPLVSALGQYEMVLQSDSNIVVYRISNGLNAIWSSGTVGRGGVVLVLQNDGNIVLYTYGGTAIWATGTQSSHALSLAMQDDGNLVAYDGARPRWATGTDVAGQVVAIARSQIGYKTNPSNSDCNYFTWTFPGRGNPAGCGYQTRAEAWCSDFANWVWANAGAGINGLTAYSYSFVTWGQQHGTFKAGPTNNPQPGDAVVWAISPTNSAHIGTVMAVRNDGWIKVISGNDGNEQVGGQENWFNPATSSIDGDPIIGYTSPLASALAASRGGAPIYTPPVSQAQIDAQRPWTPR